MGKIRTSLLTAFMAVLISISTTTLAQDRPEGGHFMYGNVLIDGSTKEFSARMKEEGYRKMMNYKDMSIFFGDFEGWEDRMVIGFGYKPLDLTFMVITVIGSFQDWDAVEACYTDAKARLDARFGQQGRTEAFPEGVSSGQDKLRHIQENGFYYQTMYHFPDGEVVLSVTRDGRRKLRVCISHHDAANSAAVEKASPGYIAKIRDM